MLRAIKILRKALLHHAVHTDDVACEKYDYCLTGLQKSILVEGYRKILYSWTIQIHSIL